MPVANHGRPPARMQPAALRLALIGAAIVAFGTALAGAAPASASHPSSGAAAGRKHPCQTEKLRHLRASNSCTHGADPVPAGYQVGKDVAPVAPAAAGGAAVGCDGDGTTGNRVQVVYFRASDVPSRYSAYLASFRAWAAGVDSIFSDSAAQTGGQRSVRFVHDASCVVTVANVVGSPGSDDDFGSTVTALQAAGHDRADRNYMVFVDANALCGVGTLYGDDQPGATNANNFGPRYGRTDSGCWGPAVPAHELMHNLGGVQLSAPHTSGGWHCVDEYDRMCYSDEPYFPAMQVLCPSSAHDALFDCGDDDYFNTSPPAGSYLATHWNAANNQFLLGSSAPPPPPCPDGAIEDADDGTAAAARSIVPGTTESRALCATSDADWYRFDRAAGAPIRLETLNLAPAADTVLTLYADDGTTQIATNDDSAGTLASAIDFTPSSSGTYRMKVEQYGGAGSSAATYDVRVDTSPSSCPDAGLEPDDTAADARSVAVGTTESRAFCRTGDEDWVSFTASSGTVYRLETSGLTGGNDTVLTLFADDGTTQIAEDDDGGGSLASVIEFTAPSSGRYRLRARHYSGRASAAYGYTLRVAANDTTAPAVVARSPAAGASGVAVTESVAVTFSEAVQGVSTATLQLLPAAGGAALPGSVSRSGTTNEWILDPAAELAAGTGYTVRLTGGIADLAGNPLAATDWSFSTVAPSPVTTPRPTTTVTQPSRSSTTPPAVVVTPPPPPPPPAPPSAAVVGVTIPAAVSLRRLLRGFRATGDRAGRFTVRVALAGRRLTIASGSAWLRGAGAVTVRPRLTRAGARAIRGRRRTRVAVVVTFRPEDGGPSMVARRTVRLRLRG